MDGFEKKKKLKVKELPPDDFFDEEKNDTKNKDTNETAEKLKNERTEKPL